MGGSKDIHSRSSHPYSLHCIADNTPGELDRNCTIAWATAAADAVKNLSPAPLLLLEE